MNTIKAIAINLEAYKIKAYTCGGTTRDMLLGKNPYGFDFAVTCAIQELTTKLKNIIVRINSHSTSVTVRINGKEVNLYPLKKIKLNNTYYSQTHTESLLEDSNSRDFTVNAIYYDPLTDTILDFHNGQDDLKNKIVRFVGCGEDRIMESKIRLLRAPVLTTILGPEWNIDVATAHLITTHRLKLISAHTKQVSIEMTKLLTRCETPSKFFSLAISLKLIEELFPELLKTISLEQSNKGAGMTLYDHIMLSLDSVPTGKNNTLMIRLAALLHDIAKPHTFVVTETGPHFYNHENIGAVMSERVLYRWGFAKELSTTVALLVKNHLFDSRVIASPASVKKFIARVGESNVHNLLDLRVADRIGSGVKNISTARVEHLRDRVNKQLSTVSPEEFKLAISGYDILQNLSTRYGETGATALTSITNYLKLKIQLGRLENRHDTIIKAFDKVAKINCPLGKEHLFTTWSELITDSADTTEQNKLSCGIFCNFLCNRKHLPNKK